MRLIRIAMFVGVAWAASAQESQLGSDFRREGTAFKSDCLVQFSFGSLASCAQVLFTDHPLHIALGSLAPGNGFAAGPAFVAHWTPNESWRLSWDTDAVVSSNGSWRAGAYMTAVLTPRTKIGVGTGTGNGVSVPKSSLAVHEYPVFHLYAQATSLNKVSYFGLGQGTRDTDRSYFGMRETIVGADVVYPVAAAGKLNFSLLAEANGRFVDIRARQGETSPSIEQLYSDTTAPGLRSQPGFAQFGEGFRLRPQLAGGFVRLDYTVKYQQYVAGNSVNSFERFTADLSHQFPLYRNTRTNLPRDFNGPDDCRADVQVKTCPAISRNLEGSFGVRFLYTRSMIPGGNVVPFYFDPTLGGSDINGNPGLSSYQDYRFRGPNLLLLRGSFEHSLYGPIGFSFMVDEGKVALRGGDLDFTHLAHSYSAGLTLRAGGFPQVYLLFAFGGHEGTHTIGSLNTALLGGSSRPPL